MVRGDMPPWELHAIVAFDAVKLCRVCHFLKIFLGLLSALGDFEAYAIISFGVSFLGLMSFSQSPYSRSRNIRGRESRGSFSFFSITLFQCSPCSSRQSKQSRFVDEKHPSWLTTRIGAAHRGFAPLRNCHPVRVRLRFRIHLILDFGDGGIPKSTP